MDGIPPYQVSIPKLQPLNQDSPQAVHQNRDSSRYLSQALDQDQNQDSSQSLSRTSPEISPVPSPTPSPNSSPPVLPRSSLQSSGQRSPNTPPDASSQVLNRTLPQNSTRVSPQRLRGTRPPPQGSDRNSPRSILPNSPRIKLTPPIDKPDETRTSPRSSNPNSPQLLPTIDETNIYAPVQVDTHSRLYPFELPDSYSLQSVEEPITPRNTNTTVQSSSRRSSVENRERKKENTDIPAILPDSALTQQAAITLQQHIRTFISTIKTFYSKKKDTYATAFRHHKTDEPVLFKIRSRYAGVFLPKEWTVLPPKIELPVEQLKKGGFKLLTHENKNYVVHTLATPELQKKIRIKELKFSIPPEILEIISNHKLKCIVPQIPVSKLHMIATNLGPKNLRELLQKEGYRLASGNQGKLSVSHFVELARELDFLYSKYGIVHRDITLMNLFFYDGRIVLTDTDSMGIVGKLNTFFGTKQFACEKFLHGIDDNQPGKTLFNAHMRDKYSFFFSMLIACYPNDTSFSLEQFKQFAAMLPCSQELKKELVDFLFDRQGNTVLTQSFTKYLTSAISPPIVRRSNDSLSRSTDSLGSTNRTRSHSGSSDEICNLM